MRYLIPIASDDNLFPREDYHFPKPLIEINGVPMIGLVVESIRSRDPEARFVFVVRHDDCLDFSLDSSLRLLAGEDTKIVKLGHPTKGAVCTALLAIEHIDDDEPLVLCNGDQVIEADLGYIARYFVSGGYDAGVVTFDSVHPRWSYARKNQDGEVLETAEKRVISRHAIAGYYYFKSGRAFIEAAQANLMKADPVAGKFYISPCLNEIILGGGRVGSIDIPTDAYISFYSPQRIEYYQTHHAKPTVIVKKRKGTVTQIVIPMAGLGSRFSEKGYAKPKPFIDVAGKTMIERVMDNLRVDKARFVLIARQAHLEAEPAVRAELERRPDVRFSSIDFVTEGAVCTVLTARPLIDPEAPLLIANCDQIVDFDCADFIRDAQARDLDGSILVFRDLKRDPKWSFARTNDKGFVIEVKEKVAISDMATVGLYYFKRAGDFINASVDMMAHNDRVNNEFYVCPVYNYLIRSGARVGVYFVSHEAMHGIGTPDDLQAYMELI